MLRVKIDSFKVKKTQAPSPLVEIELKGYATDNRETLEEFSKDKLNSGFVLISEDELNHKIIFRQSRKSNPLMVNFEEYTD